MLLSQWSSLILSALQSRFLRNSNRGLGRRGVTGSLRIPSQVQVLEDRQYLSAALITVTIATDPSGPHAGISLRDAIATANGHNAGDTVQFAKSLSGSTITLTQGELLVTGAVTISGTATGSYGITIDGGNKSRIFDVYTSASASRSVIISGLTLQHGNGVGAQGSGTGGAIYNAETLSLFGVTFVNNTAVSYGGAVNNRSTLAATDCTFFANTVTGKNGYGGAIANPYAFVTTMTNDTIVGNSVTGTGGTGGGISNLNGREMVAINTLIMGNSASSSSDLQGTLTSPQSKSNLIGIPLGQTLSTIFQTSSGTPVVSPNGFPTASIAPAETIALLGISTNPAVTTGSTPLTTLSASVPTAAVGTIGTIKVAATTYLQPGDWISLDSEIVRINSIIGTSLVVERGVLGTTPAAHSSGINVMVTDQRGFIRNAHPDLGAFETLPTAVSNVTIASGPYTGSPFAVTDATVTSGATTVGTFGSPYLSYAYYAGTLTPAQILTATPLAGPPKNVGNYTVVATYNDAPGFRPSTSGPVYFSITQATLEIDASDNTKVYDSTTAAAAVPTYSGLLDGDSISNLHEAYQSKDVLGTNGSTMYVTTYTINDGNGGNNYTVVTVTHTGTITPAPLTIAAVTDSKQYDGTTSSNQSPTGIGLLGTDTVTGTQAFQSKNVLGDNNSVLYVISYTVNDGNGGNDYTISDPPLTAAGTITKAPLVITAVTATKQYDTTLTATGTPVVLSTLYDGDTVTNLTQAFQDKNVHGTNGSSIAITSWTVNDGNNGHNYDYQFSTAAGTIIPAPLTITPVTASKVYDRTTSSSVKPTASGLLGTDSFNGTQVYNSAIPSSYPGGATSLSISAYAINDGNKGNNYSVAQVPSVSGTITIVASLVRFQDTPVTNITAGVPIYSQTTPAGTVPVSVAIKDATNTYVINTDNTSVVRITLDHGTFASSGLSYVEAQASSGVATFSLNPADASALLITQSGSYNMTVTIPASPSIPSIKTAGPTVVKAAAPTQLNFLSSVPNGSANVALGSFQIQALDQYGNAVTGLTINLAVNSYIGSGSAGVLTGSSSQTNSSGIATFSAVKLSKAGTYTLKAYVTTPDFPMAISNSLTIT
jgi:hypothetical protein